MVEKNQKKNILDTRKLHEIQVSVSRNNMSLAHSHARLSTQHMWLLLLHNCRVEELALGPTTLTIFTFESFPESLLIPALSNNYQPRQWFPKGVPGNTPYEVLWDKRVPQWSKSGLLCLLHPAPSREEQ